MVLTESQVRNEGRNLKQQYRVSAKSIANEQLQKLQKGYDIFLSHASDDEEIILGVYKILRDRGFAVFVDWIEAPNIDRTQVTVENAEFIRQSMSKSNSMIVADSKNAEESKWICWEVGSFDGHGPIGIFKLDDTPSKASGREFLELYPQVSLDSLRQLVVTESPLRPKFKTGGAVKRGPQPLREWIKRPDPNLKAF